MHELDLTYPLLLDGGLSNELERQGCDLNHKLWSAKMLIGHPEAIIQAHLNYLRAGSRCIITSSYQASIDGFMNMGYDRHEAEDFIQLTVRLAQIAIKRFKAEQSINYEPLIAASIGPYGAFLADGSEYSGDYGVSDDALRRFHSSRIKILDRSAADCFAVETIPSLQESRVLNAILEETLKPAWISFSCADNTSLHDGSLISDAVQLFADNPNVFAIGANCTAPEYISGIIKTLKSIAPGKKIVVYPNSGEVFDPKTKTWRGLSDPGEFTVMAREWIALGVDIIGGCCRIGPRHIAQLKQVLS